jgi:hypothetical protein
VQPANVIVKRVFCSTTVRSADATGDVVVGNRTVVVGVSGAAVVTVPPAGGVVVPTVAGGVVVGGVVVGGVVVGGVVVGGVVVGGVVVGGTEEAVGGTPSAERVVGGTGVCVMGTPPVNVAGTDVSDAARSAPVAIGTAAHATSGIPHSPTITIVRLIGRSPHC